MEAKEYGGAVRRQVTVFNQGAFRTEERELVEEVGYQLTVDGRPAGQIACSPWGVRQAVLGALYMQGRISGAADVCRLEICQDSGEIRVCLQPQKASPPVSVGGNTPGAHSLSAENICRLAAALENSSRLFRRTGGVHCAALSRGGGFLAYAEDVSRHVAVDKLAGSCLEQGISMENGILVFSGRVPGEIIHKAAAMRCSAVIARSAPTDYSCRLAEKLGITLIGFARDTEFNVYSCPHRLVGL